MFNLNFVLALLYFLPFALLMNNSLKTKERNGGID